MPNPIVQSTIDQITATDNVIDSATLLINSIGKLVSDAVSAALANGATAAELAPVSDVVTALKQKSDALAAAVAANTTPPAPPTPPSP